MRLRARWSDARVGLVLCYHEIVEPEGTAGRDLSGAISRRDFERHLRHLWQLLERAWNRDLVDSGMLAAWDIRERDPSVREVARRIQQMSPSEREAATASLRAAFGGEAPDETLSRSGVEALAAAGFEIGFHTQRHDDLTGLDDRELRLAMSAGRAELERASGPLSMISYPHGRADRRVAAAARAAGFHFGYLADGSPVRPGDDPHLLGRRYPATGSGQFAIDVARTLFGPPTPRSDRLRHWMERG